MLDRGLCSHRHTNKGVGDGYLEPHPVPHFQTWLWAGHGLSNCCHVAVDGEVEVIESWERSGDTPQVTTGAEVVWVWSLSNLYEIIMWNTKETKKWISHKCQKGTFCLVSYNLNGNTAKCCCGIETTPKFPLNNIWFPVVWTVIRPMFCLDQESHWIRQDLCLRKDFWFIQARL